MASNVINQPIGATAKLIIVVKIRKYKGFHKVHHFILMALEVHNASQHHMDHFIKECGRLSMIDDQEVIYPCIFAFNFLGNVLVLLFNVF
jgi:hypothetical protein